MNSPVLKITIHNDDSYLEIYEKEPGKLALRIDSTNPLSPDCCGVFETDARALIEMLQKLLNK